MDIQLDIEGVSDPAIVKAIRQRVRRIGREVGRGGECRVSVAPSETRGEWNLGIRALHGWHVAWFAEPAERLPELVDRALREHLAVSA